jgi:magnesium chelatase family protein
MLAKIDSACLQGLDGFRVQVEINIISGLPSFSIVGLPDASVREAKDRVVAAIRNTGFEFPAGRVTVNLSPADLRKEGSLYDVAMAVGILLAGEGIPCHRYPRCVWLGELALDGTIQPIRGVMPMLHSLHQKGWDQFVIPEGNLREASGVEGVQLFPFRTLKQLLEWVQDKAPVQAVPVERTWVPERIQARVDLSEIKGQPSARRALEIAAAGNHNVLLVGPPGSGKSLLANALPGILPSWSYTEAMETTQLYSITGSLADGGVLTQRPFRNPHHTISPAALIGGGDTPLPGEISLAHRGVLFLDELSEFRHDTLEALRQPLEEGKVSIQRTWG